MKPATAASFARGDSAARVGLLDRRQQQRPALGEELVEHLVLGVEVVVDEAVGDARPRRRCRRRGSSGSPGGRRPDRGVEDVAAFVDRRRLCLGHQACISASCGQAYASGRRLASEGSDSRTSLLGGEVEVGGDEALARRGRWRARCPRGRRSRSGRRSRNAAAPCRLVRGEDEGLVLDRPRPQQNLPVVAAGGRGEGGGHRDQPGAAHGEDPEELGEAKVVADGQARRSALRPAAVTISEPGSSCSDSR